MFQAAIFDLDGVLTQTEGVHMHMVRLIFKQVYGYEITEDDLKLVVARHSSDYVPELVSLHQLDPVKEAEIMDNYQRVYAELWEKESELIPGVTEVLAALAKLKVNLSLATNSSKGSFDAFVRKFRFDGVFGKVTTGEEVKKKKPDPEIYNIAKNKLDFPVDKILVIEDSEPGVLSAKAAGLKVAAVYNQYTAYQDFSQADYRFKTLSEILALF